MALLFAPKSGSELRGEIADVTRKGYDATLETAEKLKTQSTEALHTVRKKAEEVYDFAAAKLNASNAEIADAVSTAGNAITEGIDDINEDAKVRMKHASSGRKPASIF